MRFLLHPRRSNLVKGSGSYVLSKAAAVAKALPATALPSVLSPTTKREAPPSNAAAVRGVRDRGLSPIPTSTISAPEPSANASRRRAWGQQCSERCGCVVRFEAEIRGGIVETASYHAKQLVLANPPATAPSLHHHHHHRRPHAPGLTTKGRPMFQACDCAALHHLSSVVVDHMAGASTRRLKNSLEFRSPRSSAAFRSAALRAQGLPAEGGAGCFDLVEEAVTALLKGHLPRPRPPPAAAVVGGDRSPGPWSAPEAKQSGRFPVPRHAWQGAHGDWDDEDDDEEEDEALPSMFWRLPSSAANGSRHDSASPTSTLRLLDLADARASSALSRRSAPSSSYLQHRLRGRRRGVPRDWVSYVDELHWHYESSA